jgi:hypothetical protein
VFIDPDGIHKPACGAQIVSLLQQMAVLWSDFATVNGNFIYRDNW